ncbi:MAG: VCBS repeat-containing protein, partial [Flavobacteriaceae bacterium]|nr:VCBS repeat-containing protein [Flavobacteriaceae bacterium]
VQTDDDQFRPLDQGNTFEKIQDAEHVQCDLFDADGDGDLDLMVGTGGNQVGDAQSYRPRLYLNNGKGSFTASEKQLPSSFKNVSTLEPYDFDQDGDVDVFLGSRSVVGTYGVNPDHLFLENDGQGNFSDATERLAYDLKDAGMITSSTWADMDGDGKKDLVTVSDWGSPLIFRNNGRRLSKTKSSLDSLGGWWNVVEAEDLDKDGDMDLILGNQGGNLHYKPGPGQPMKMWVNDFDNNGTIEQIVTQTQDGADYPLHQKKELTNQMVALKKQNLKASDYAKRTIEELFPGEVISNSIVKKAVISESVIAINEGEGNFTIKKLPPRVQLSCVCGITCTDLNKDGYTDILLGGNNFEFKPQYSRLDANYGSVLLGGENLDFKWQDYEKSGFFVREEIKHLKAFKDSKGRTYLVVAINDKEPKIYALDE